MSKPIPLTNRLAFFLLVAPRGPFAHARFLLNRAVYRLLLRVLGYRPVYPTVRESQARIQAIGKGGS